MNVEDLRVFEGAEIIINKQVYTMEFDGEFVLWVCEDMKKWIYATLNYEIKGVPIELHTSKGLVDCSQYLGEVKNFDQYKNIVMEQANKIFQKLNPKSLEELDAKEIPDSANWETDIDTLMDFRQEQWDLWVEFVKDLDGFCNHCSNHKEFCSCTEEDVVEEGISIEEWVEGQFYSDIETKEPCEDYEDWDSNRLNHEVLRMKDSLQRFLFRNNVKVR